MKRIAILLCTLAALGVSLAGAQGKFSGYMFGDYFYNVARDSAFRTANLPNSAVSGQKDLNAFAFRRIYLTYDNDISEQFTTRFRLEADGSALTANGKFTTFVKDAYLTWKNIFSGSNMTFGLQPTPVYEISEAAWGYRSLEKTIMDLRGTIPSRYLGLGLRGKIDDGGMFGYWAMVSDNTTSTSVPNASDAYTGKFKRFTLLLHLKPVKNLQITLTGDYLGAPAVNDPTSTSAPKATLSNSTTTLAGFVGYAEPESFSVGVEGFMATKANGMIDASSTSTPKPLKGVSALGLSFFGWVNFSPTLAVVGRYDMYDPNTDSNVTGDKRNYIIASLVYKPTKNVSIMPNVQFETYESVPNGPSFDSSITGRLTFYYIFL
jgi:hypothetical protein